MCVVKKVTNSKTLVKYYPGENAGSGDQNLALMIGRIFKPAGLLST